ncbi:MAG TPA: hypothetical protein PK306_12635 [Aquabacterium sp.]|jgi:hypothetical protein|nr:hypothetical protein [Aquabacterium sp.]
MRVEWQVPPALQNVTLGRPVAKPLTRVVDVIEEGQAMQHCASAIWLSAHRRSR